MIKIILMLNINIELIINFENIKNNIKFSPLKK